jgi:hypothetical protein
MRGLSMPALAAILTVGTQGVTCTAQAASLGSYHKLLAGSGMCGITVNAGHLMMSGSFISKSFISESLISESCTGLPQREGLPGGDYKETCRDVRMNGSLLEANCQKRDGGWRSTSLDTRSCNRGIINDNGNLRCPDVGGRQGGIPPGDYRRTCKDMRVSGQRLDATCQKEDGNWRNTSLDNFSRCGNQISNVDGHLTCGR